MGTKKLILGVDLDNVLALTDPLIRRLIKKAFNIRLEQHHIVEFDYWRCGISKEQNQIVFDRFHRLECANVRPIKQAVETLRYLGPRYKVYVVTSRPPATRKLTTQWLKSHKIPFDKLIYSESKRDSQINFDAFVEDHRETAYSMARRGVLSFLLDYPWNQPNPIDPPNLIRVKSWRRIRAYLDKLASEPMAFPMPQQ